MTYHLFQRPVTPKTMAAVAFVALGLGTMGTADAQGLAAGVQAPAYGTPWAAKHRWHSANFTSSMANGLQDDRALDDVRASSGRTASD